MWRNTTERLQPTEAIIPHMLYIFVLILLYFLANTNLSGVVDCVIEHIDKRNSYGHRAYIVIYMLWLRYVYIVCMATKDR